MTWPPPGHSIQWRPHAVRILKTMSESFDQVLSSDLAARYDLANMYSGLIATQAKLTQECWTDFTDAVATVLKNTVTVAW
jgi:hypothetical protein